ncbi:putative casparian strip membrane protein [Medicago truncatula]|uniref:CASP-like protein n=1 Tax=Medicago truncatula TaxID=3880 RepID=A0A072TPZ4_MEDTR|nr:CASP-like protein 2C1 [Medicago truncatula]KEH15650.1 CASP POPTRDRAFT-like protein [Medicago truncatula]RHN64762.1 putative casparian strip membrane protein [Medicago truncatula]
MEFRMAKGEVLLRVSAILFLVSTACIVAFDTETKVVILMIKKKATYKDLDALKILLYVTSAAAGYNMLQLCKHSFSACSTIRNFNDSYYMHMAWISFLLDQIVVYLTFATNTSAFEACLFALTGSEAFQWMKVCNKFTRFCYQIGGAILCCYIASILMAMISTISAYKVLRMYSPKRFLRLKGK